MGKIRDRDRWNSAPSGVVPLSIVLSMLEEGSEIQYMLEDFNTILFIEILSTVLWIYIDAIRAEILSQAEWDSLYRFSSEV